MTTTHTALIAEARNAMEGITEGEWEAVPSAPNEGYDCFWLYGPFGQFASVDGSQTDERACANARFLTWSGNGGVRRLVEAVEGLKEKMREAEERSMLKATPGEQPVCGVCGQYGGQSDPPHAEDCPFAVLNEEATDGG